MDFSGLLLMKELSGIEWHFGMSFKPWSVKEWLLSARRTAEPSLFQLTADEACRWPHGNFQRLQHGTAAAEGCDRPCCLASVTNSPKFLTEGLQVLMMHAGRTYPCLSCCIRRVVLYQRFFVGLRRPQAT